MPAESRSLTEAAMIATLAIVPSATPFAHRRSRGTRLLCACSHECGLDPPIATHLLLARSRSRQHLSFARIPALRDARGKARPSRPSQCASTSAEV